MKIGCVKNDAWFGNKIQNENAYDRGDYALARFRGDVLEHVSPVLDAYFASEDNESVLQGYRGATIYKVQFLGHNRFALIHAVLNASEG